MKIPVPGADIPEGRGSESPGIPPLPAGAEGSDWFRNGGDDGLPAGPDTLQFTRKPVRNGAGSERNEKRADLVRSGRDTGLLLSKNSPFFGV